MNTLDMAADATEHKAPRDPGNGSSRPHFDTLLTITIFSDQFAQYRQFWTGTLPDLAHYICVPEAADKADLPWLKLAGFGDALSNKGCYRSNANMVWISGVEGDYDGGTRTSADAADLFREAGVLALLYTTPSNTDANPRWRALCPTSKLLKPAEREGLMDRLNGIIGGGFAGESWTRSQAYYFGNVAGRAPVQTVLVDGEHIDCRPDLPTLPKPGGGTEAVRDHPDARESSATPISIETLRAMGEAARGPCADLHYPELRTVIFGVARIPVEGDEDRAVREEVARSIWAGNTASASLTDDKFDALLTEPARYNTDGSLVGPGTFVHYAKLGGWRGASPESMYGNPEAFAEYTAASGAQEQSKGAALPAFRTLWDIRAAEFKDEGQWIWHERLLAFEPNLYTGLPGIGKTTLSEAIAIAVAGGVPLLGQATRRMPVALLIAEDTYGPVRDNLLTLAQSLGVDEQVFRNLHLLSVKSDRVPGGHVLARISDDGKIEDTTFMREAVAPFLRGLGGEALLIIDPLAEFFALDLNKDAAARALATKFLAECCAINGKRMTLLVNHHPTNASVATGVHIGNSVQVRAAFSLTATLRQRDKNDGDHEVTRLNGRIVCKPLAFQTMKPKYGAETTTLFYRTDGPELFTSTRGAQHILTDRLRRVYQHIIERLEHGDGKYTSKDPRSDYGPEAVATALALTPADVVAAMNACRAQGWLTWSPRKPGKTGTPAHWERGQVTPLFATMSEPSPEDY